jgi:hypothetical protein
LIQRFAHPLVSIALLLALGACKPALRGHQGWVEGDFMFIGPEESGRVTELAVSAWRVAVGIFCARPGRASPGAGRDVRLRKPNMGPS